MREWLIALRGNETQEQIAEKCDLSQNYYCWIELGKRDPSVETAKKIAQALGFDWTRFFEINKEIS